MTPVVMDPGDESKRYVSRGGIKLAHALRTLGADPAGKRCADFGCNVGGFTDCLLQHGALSVIALDTAYGILDYRLRKDGRVLVMERTNVLHTGPPSGGVDLVVVDAGWTPQRLVIPKAKEWLTAGGEIVTLIKPHYELAKIPVDELGRSWPGLGGKTQGVLDEDVAEWTAQNVRDWMEGVGGVEVLGLCRSPIRGGKTRGVEGNVEYLARARVRG